MVSSHSDGGDPVHVLRSLLCASVPVEPEELRSDLRIIAGEDPGAAPSTIAEAIAAELWEAWKAALAPAWRSPADLGPVLERASRESWLWVMGERNWAHTAEGLAGRVARAVGARSADTASL